MAQAIRAPVRLKNRQYETLTELNARGLKVRVWRTADSLQDARNFEHASFVAGLSEITGEYHPDKWQDQIMALPRVACVAIVDQSGNGVSAYPDWH